MIPKFRGRSVEAFSEEEWKYGYLIEDEGYSFIINQVIEANEQYITIGSWCPVNPDTLGQSTGLKDKNGKEIFEGDVVKCNGLLGTIESFKAMWICSFVKYNNYQKVGFFAQEIEVVGNIYENPELLEDKE